MAASQVKDIVAFSGQRDYRTLPSGFTRAQLTATIVTSMVAGGWTVRTGPTAQAFGDGYTLVSQQSPWYDPDNIPAWYLGNRAVLIINNSESATDIRLRAAADYDGTIEHQMVPGERFNLRVSEVSGADFLVHSNPYQMLYWTAADPGAGLITQDTNMQLASFMISAVNLPKPIQQRTLPIHCIFATNRLRGWNTGLGGASTGQDYACYRVKGEAGAYTGTSLGTSGLRFMSPVGGISPTARAARRIWNRALDPGMEDETQWSGFFVPPYMTWLMPGESVSTINGFLWDAFVYSEGFRLQSTGSLKGRNWIMYGGTNKYDPTPSVGASLWINTDV